MSWKHKGHNLILKNHIKNSRMVAHAFNPDTGEVKTGGFVKSQPSHLAWWDPSQASIKIVDSTWGLIP